MFWYDNLYLGKKCLRQAGRLKYKIANRIPHRSVYLIVLPQSDHSVLEIIPSAMLLQEAYPRDNLRVIGIGANRREALELIRQIIDEVYRQQGDFDVEAFVNQWAKFDDIAAPVNQ